VNMRTAHSAVRKHIICCGAQHTGRKDKSRVQHSTVKMLDLRSRPNWTNRTNEWLPSINGLLGLFAETAGTRRILSSTVGSAPLGKFSFYLILRRLTRTPIHPIMIRSGAF
jgi:hypothetical protein